MNLQNKKVLVKPRKLSAGKSLSIHGYKHAMVQIFATSVATTTKVSIMNVPVVDDTRVLCEIINYCGGSAKIIDHKVYH